MIVVFFSLSHLSLWPFFHLIYTDIFHLFNHTTATSTSIPYWAFSMKSFSIFAPVCDRVCAYENASVYLCRFQYSYVVLFDYRTLCCWVDLCILVLFITREFSWFYWSLTCTLWLLMFEMFVVCMCWIDFHFDHIGSVVPMGFYVWKWFDKCRAYTTIPATASWNWKACGKLSCKVKPTQFVYHIPKLFLSGARAFQSKMFASAINNTSWTIDIVFDFVSSIKERDTYFLQHLLMANSCWIILKCLK